MLCARRHSRVSICAAAAQFNSNNFYFWVFKLVFKLSKFELFCFSSHWPSALPDELTTRCAEFALLKIDARLFSELQPSISIEFIPTLCFIIEYVDGNYSVHKMRHHIKILYHANAWIQDAINPFLICTVTVTRCTAFMRETWGPYARASQCCEKSLRRDVLA